MIGITMGDANGVGPEILLKAYSKNRLDFEFIVIGDYSILQACNLCFGYKICINKCEDISQIKSDCLNVLDANLLTKEDLTIGQISEKAGLAAFSYIVTATRLALDSKIDAIVTLPVNKEAIQITRPDFSGHTELIAGLCNQTDFTMMLASDKLTVTHVSTHLSMENAIKAITADRVYSVIKLTDNALKNMYGSYKIAVAGLNPHAGEGGSFGSEEIDHIIPAINRAKAESINVEGPIPADSVFIKSYNKQYQAVVCMYHDQGHIPMKLLDFEGGVNITLGLKIIRTSVDHGTAYDIAWKNIASEENFIRATQYARMLLKISESGLF